MTLNASRIVAWPRRYANRSFGGCDARYRNRPQDYGASKKLGPPGQTRPSGPFSSLFKKAYFLSSLF
jgi:hypothetical protein